MKTKKQKKKATRRKQRVQKVKKKSGAHLGQHFLSAQWVASAMVEAARVPTDIPVLEIGPGTGNLTKELLRTGYVVYAVEKDTALIEVLRARFEDEITSDKLHIIAGDVRSIEMLAPQLLLFEYALVANIPYYITGDIIRTFLERGKPPVSMTLLVQKEVAERIAKDTKESILSLSVKLYGAPRYVAKVARGCFTPPPNVDSAILHIDHISKEKLRGFSEETFFKIVHKAFAGKRKMLGNTLRTLFSPETLKERGIDPKSRAEDLPLSTWTTLARLHTENPISLR